MQKWLMYATAYFKALMVLMLGWAGLTIGLPFGQIHPGSKLDRHCCQPCLSLPASMVLLHTTPSHNACDSQFWTHPLSCKVLATLPIQSNLKPYLSRGCSNGLATIRKLKLRGSFSFSNQQCPEKIWTFFSCQTLQDFSGF